MKFLIVINLLMCSLSVTSKDSKWLKTFTLYNQPTYYKSAVFAAHNETSFFQLKDIQKTVKIDSFDLHLLNACLFYVCNKIRIQHKLLPFKMDEQLKQVASVHSYQMSVHHFFDHYNSFEPALKKPLDRFKALNIEFVSYAENCHKEFLEDDEISYLQLAQQAIESLYNSPVHRKNILNKNYVFGVSGAALEKTKDGFFLLVTQNFYNN